MHIKIDLVGDVGVTEDLLNYVPMDGSINIHDNEDRNRPIEMPLDDHWPDSEDEILSLVIKRFQDDKPIVCFVTKKQLLRLVNGLK